MLPLGRASPSPLPPFSTPLGIAWGGAFGFWLWLGAEGDDWALCHDGIPTLGWRVGVGGN